MEFRRVLFRASATSENFGVSSDEVNEVEPNVGQLSASIPPANTIENAHSPKIHSLRRCFPRCFFSSSRTSKRMTLSSSEPRFSFGTIKLGLPQSTNPFFDKAIRTRFRCTSYLLAIGLDRKKVL